MARGLAVFAAVVLFLCSSAARSEAVRPAADSQTEQAIPTDSDDPAAATIQRANAHAEKGETDAALKDFDEALKINPNSAWAYSARGALYLLLNKNELAIADLDRALAIDLEFEAAWFNRGLAYLNLGKFELAVRDFDAAISLNAKDAAAYIERGRAHAILQKFDEALADFAKAIELEPNNVLAYTNRAAVHMSMGKFKDALADCDEALKHDPKNTFALFIRSSAYAVLGDLESSLKDLDAALAIDPEYSEALRARGLLYSAKGQPQRAIADLDGALKLMPNDPTVLKARGDAHYALKHWDPALADFDRVIAMKPDDLHAHTYRFAILVESGRGDQARSECRALIAGNPGKGWPYLACAEIKRRSGDFKGANQEIAKAAEIDPTIVKNPPSGYAPTPPPDTSMPPPVRALLDGMRHAEMGDYDEAANDFERADKLGLRGGDTLPRLCKALAHTKRLDDAVYQCSRALQLSPNDGELLEARGTAYFKLGKFKLALQDFADLTRIFPQNARYLYERGVTKKKLGDTSGGDKDTAAATSIDAHVVNKVPTAFAL